MGDMTRSATRLTVKSMRPWVLLLLGLWRVQQATAYLCGGYRNPKCMVAGRQWTESRRESVVRTAVAAASEAGGEEKTAAGDLALSTAMTALGEDNIQKARTELSVAEAEYRASDVLGERQDLLDAVKERIADAAVRIAKERAGTSASLEETGPRAAKAKEEGEKFLLKATEAYNKKEFMAALEYVNSSREAFSSAGDGGKLAREREIVLGNLYSVVIAEYERQQKIEKLLRLKKIKDLIKLKEQAELFGIDWEEFKEVAGIEDPS